MQILIILGAAHLVICVLSLLICRIPAKEAVFLLILALFLPVIGVLCVIFSTHFARGWKEPPISKLYKKTGKDNMTVTAGRHELDTVVPFDEVLLLSNDHARREVMMHLLRRDPFAYLEMLKIAKGSSDVEITHYATTTIMEIQRELDISMQKAEEDFHEQPDNLEAVNRFISVLSSYIDTGLLLENRIVQLRTELHEVLEHKLLLFPNSRSAHQLLVETGIKLGNYSRAAETAAAMRSKWPNDEISWLKSLHVCMASGSAEEKENIAALIKTTPINWSHAGREEVEFLCG